MFKKVLFFSVMAGMTILYPAVAQTKIPVQMTARQTISHYAKKGNLKALQQLKAKGYNIDLTDAKGNTSLCDAVWQQDKNAVATLIKVGASQNSQCMQKIPQNYKQAVGLKNVGTTVAQTSTTAAGTAGGDVATTGTTVGTVATAGSATATGATVASAGTFLGMGAVGWGITGAVVAGGAVAAAAGGGGGGSGNSAPACSGHGFKNDDGGCSCNTGWIGDNCENKNTACTGNKTQISNCTTQTNCKYGDETLYTCTTCNTGYLGDNCNTCASDYVRFGNSCVAKIDCHHGNQIGDGVCSCNEGWTGDAYCSTATNCGENYVATCPTGYTYSNTCQSGDSTLKLCNICDTGYTKSIDGQCISENVNLNCPTDAQQVGNTCVCNDTNSIYQNGVCYTILNCSEHMMQVGNKCICENGYVEQNGICYLKLNCGAGVQVKDSCVCNSDAIKRNGVCLKVGKSANRNNSSIVIENIGNEHICGLLGVDSDNLEVTFNAYAYAVDNIPTQTIGTINIMNKGDGNIFGLYSYNNAVNAAAVANPAYLSSSSIKKATATGTIDIINEGTGSVFGISSGSLAGNAASDTSLSSNKTADASGMINITNNGSGNIFGLYAYNDAYNSIMTSQGSNSTMTTTGTINIKNTGDGYVYGLYSFGLAFNAYTKYDSNSSNVIGVSSGTINIKNAGDGYVYGLYSLSSSSVANTYIYDFYSSSNSSDNIGTIDITNEGKGNTYGIYFPSSSSPGMNAFAYAQGSKVKAIGIINIRNNGIGNAYGIYSSYAYNASAGSDSTATGIIDVTNNSKGNVYGIYSFSNSASSYNASAGSDSTATGIIDVTNNSNGSAWGIYSNYGSHNSAFGNGKMMGTIKIKNFGTGNAYGLYGKWTTNESSFRKSSVINILNYNTGLVVGIHTLSGVNSGDITIHNLNDGTAVGIMTDSGTVTNSGTITINRSSYTDDKGTEDTSDDVTYTATSSIGGTAIGIYGGAGSTITNDKNGTIIINDATNAYGIYSNGGTVTNKGTITIDGNSEHPNAIVLNGGQLFQNGALIVNSTPQSLSLNSVFSAPMTLQATSLNNVLETPTQQQASLNLNDFGGTVIASATSQFVVEGAISGDLAINNNVVATGFDKVYTVSDIIQASDTSGLNLISQSALFDASLENGTDVVMTMKSFDSVTDNSSLAAFLEKNYALGNNEAFFNEIKSIGNANAFKSTMDGLTGQNTIAKFTHEDLTTMREINFAMNEQMFANDDKQIFEKQGSVNGFSFKNDNHSSANYALGTKRITPRWKVGYAMSNTTINTDDDHDTTRHNQVFQVFAPIGYENSGIKLISTPQIGFARGHYTRKGFNDTSYYGVIEKRIFALMNEARYPMEVSGFEIAPTVEFNAIAYNQKGSEGNKAYSLKMPSDNNLSVEAGLGLYANKTIGNMKFNAGLMMYREFADPYNVKMGMEGMEGTFKLYDDNKEYRGVASFGFNYDLNDWNVYGKVQHFMESDNYTNMKAGIKYSF